MALSDSIARKMLTMCVSMSIRNSRSMPLSSMKNVDTTTRLVCKVQSTRLSECLEILMSNDHESKIYSITFHSYFIRIESSGSESKRKIWNLCTYQCFD